MIDAPRASAKPPRSRWRAAARERAYRRRLVEALRAAARRRASEPRDVKEAADSALALTAGGRSRWSRAILLGRHRRAKLLVKAGGKAARSRGGRPRPDAMPPPPGKGNRVRDRLRLLGRLVPGCRKLSAPSLLEETVDYVAALEMQVKSMRALVNALSAAAAAAAPQDVTEGGSPES
ncbi:transcription factor bHLH150 [Canna indica]|uniref:Transcription factor bHLH150 n=1 Tax=Canna indica TaxID=4628 RepID=A0AAQ3QFR9_9LILI|nr:transcription factor bHLH150 [Canna indica]